MALKSRFAGRPWLKLRYLARRVYHLFRFWKKEEGLPEFLSRYGADGARTIPRDERALFPSFEKCQACSLCTFSCAAVRDGIAPPAFEPKYLLLAFGRSPELAVDDWVPCAACSGCTVECPVDAPIHAMAQNIVDRLRKLGELSAAGSAKPPEERSGASA